jgi:hypothetical protein
MDAEVPEHVPGPLVERALAERYRDRMGRLHSGIFPPLPTLEVFHAARAEARA